MSDFKSLFSEGHARGIAKLAGLGGLLLALIAFALVANFWNAKNTYTKIPATITNISLNRKSNADWDLTYEYPWGNTNVMDSTSFPENIAKSLRVGGTILLLQDPETGEVMFADNEDYVGDFSRKLGIAGVVLMIGAYIFLRMNPKPGR